MSTDPRAVALAKRIDDEIFRVMGLAAPKSFSRVFNWAAPAAEPKPLETFWQEEPVIGWRVWKLKAYIRQPVGLENVRLSSYAYCTIWEPRRAVAATCEKMTGYHGHYSPPPAMHPAPHEHCSCGIHSFRDLADLIPELHYSGEGLVIGRVAHWGRTVQCRKGWRSEFGYPIDLSVLEVPEQVLWHPEIVGYHHMDARQYLAHCLQDAYGVPVAAETFHQIRQRAEVRQADAGGFSEHPPRADFR